MNIEINVGEVSLDDIVDEGPDGQPIALAEMVATILVDRLIESETWPPLRERVSRIRDEEIRELIKPTVAAVVDTPIQKTNEYGEPTGRVVQLRDLVLDEASKVLNGSADRYNGNRESLAQKLIREEVTRALNSELSEAIKAEREKVVAAVKAQAADLIAKAVAQGVGGR